MNEIHIIKPNIETPAIETSSEPKAQVIDNENLKGIQRQEEIDFINFMKFQQFFGIAKPDFDDKKLLENVYGYFNKKDYETLNEVLIDINLIEQKISNPPMGLSRLQHLWNYLKVLSQIEQYDNLKSSYERK